MHIFNLLLFFDIFVLISQNLICLSIELDINTLEKEFRRLLSMKNRLTAEVDALDPEDKHFERMKADLDDRIYSMYDQISEIEEELAIARNK